MTERLKRLLIAGKGEERKPERHRSVDAAAPPRAARKLRRDANGCMGCSLPCRDKARSGMVSLSVAGAARRPFRIRGLRRKKSSRSFALFSPVNLLDGKGITACSQEVLRSLTCLFPAC